MRIHEIIYFFKTYLLFGVMGFIALSLVGIFCYIVVYKKMLKGNKKFSKMQIVLGGLFIIYIIMVLGVTFLSRGSNFQGSMSIHFLNSYREAWNKFSVRSWQFIILNIFMFVPFGFLLPLLHKGFYKFHNTMISALLFTMFIETFQLVTGMGIFEVDDIFNNALGALIGLGLIMALISALEPSKNKGLRLAKYLSPLLITVLVFFSIFAYYDNKELGNIAQAYIYKINLKDTKIDIDTSLNENKNLVPIYKAPVYKEDEAIQWVNDFFTNKEIDASELEIDAYNDNAIYWIREKPTYNMIFYYIGGTYNFTDFSHFEDGLEPMNIEEDLLLDEIGDFGISIPEEAKFTNEDKGHYIWKVDKFIKGDTLIDGVITCTYFNDNTIKDLGYNLITYKKMRDVTIKSEKDAFEELVAGKFLYYNDVNIGEIFIKSVSLDYILDTKGFYQPIYSFKSIVDGNEDFIIIPAIY